VTGKLINYDHNIRQISAKMAYLPVLAIIFFGCIEKNENNFNLIWKFVKHKLLSCKKNNKTLILQ